MRSFYVVSLLVLSAFCWEPRLVLAGGQSGRIPSRISSADGPASEPVWLSAESEAGKGKKLADEDLPARVRSLIDREVREGIDKKRACIYYGEVNVDRAGPVFSYATLKDLVQNSKVAIQGTITDIDHGFSFYGPSTLVEIRVDEWLKKSERVSEGSFVYLVCPVAEFEAGRYRFCKTDAARWGGEPQVGDEILLFPYRVPVDQARQVFLPDPDGYEVILYRKGSGILSVPKSLKGDVDVLGVKDIETLKRRALKYTVKAEASDPSLQ